MAIKKWGVLRTRSLYNLRTLYLEVSLPTNLANLLDVSPRLRILTYLSDAYGISWSQKLCEFGLRRAEFDDFKACCEARGIYPRLEGYVSGKFSVDLAESPTPRGALVATVVDGVTIAAYGNTGLLECFK